MAQKSYNPQTFYPSIFICGQSRREKALDFSHRTQGKDKNVKLFLSTFVFLKVFLSFSFFLFISLLFVLSS